MGFNPFSKKEKKETLLLKLPDGLSLDQIENILNPEIMRENAVLHASNIKHEEREARAAEKIDHSKEEETIKRYIKKQEIERKIYQQQKSLKLIFENDTYPVFFTRGNESFGFRIKGLILKDNEDGGLSWELLLLNQDNEEKYWMKSASSFEEIFREKINIVSQIKAGKCDTNFDIDHNGKPILIKPKYKDSKTGQEIKVINLADKEVREYERRLEERKNQINELWGRVQEFEEKEAEYIMLIGEANVEANVAKKQSDLTLSKLALMNEKDITTRAILTNSLASNQELAVKANLELQLSQVLIEAVKKRDIRLGLKLGEEDKKVAEEEIRSIVNQAVAESRKNTIAEIRASRVAKVVQQPQPQK